jgi:succinate dehydrogenase / fumarate reductase flavoprotein subunit
MKTDVLIIGAGGAGLSAAIAAKEAGSEVIVLTKEYPTRSQTSMAQGGINAALGNVQEDSIEAHIHDTLKSAHNQADEEAVRFMCQKAPETIEWLDQIGVCFSRTHDAKIAQRKLGGASGVRACYAQDYTGLKILHTLYDKALSLNISLHSNIYLLDLLTDANGVACGAKVLQLHTGKVLHYYAKSVIVATGGYSRIYGTYSTNSLTSTGDGIAAAQRVGAKLLGMEFVQFHPTGLKKSSILVSEASRGEGGFVVNSQGERFTNELAPRDELSRAIASEIAKKEEVFIDLRHLGEKKIDTLLPQERKLAKLYEGVDPVTQLIPIKPVAHYTMGGIEVDHKSQTNVTALFACGECANHKVHGANRLGGNSLLEIVVFGREAGENAALFAKNNTFATPHTTSEDFFSQIKTFTNEIDFYPLREELGQLFYENVGIVRTTQQLNYALQRVDELYDALSSMGVSDPSPIYNTNLIEFLEFKNMLEIARSVAQAALQRKESCGAHYMGEELS